MKTGFPPAIVLPVVLTAACGVLGDPPPVEFSVRDSLLGAGLIVRIENTSNEPLRQLELQITSPSGEQRSYAAEELEPYGTLEVGWKKLGGWEIQPGSEISLSCDGFGRAAEATVPVPGPETDAGS